MLITRFSTVSNKENTLDINVTQEQIDSWRNGMLIQRAMPDVSAPEREFIKTGITPDEWNQMFGKNPFGNEDE